MIALFDYLHMWWLEKRYNHRTVVAMRTRRKLAKRLMREAERGLR